MDKIKEIIGQLTLEEKAGLCSGADFWHTKGVERLGIPSVMVSDGPHGLRKQEEGADHLGIHDSIKAVLRDGLFFRQEVVIFHGRDFGGRMCGRKRGGTLRPRRQYQAVSALREKFRVFFGGPFSCGRAFLRFDKRDAEKRRCRMPKAFCRQ